MSHEILTFETFVVGKANEFAYAVARRVALWDSGFRTPVLFHAPYGLGKTHLTQALFAEAQKNEGKRVKFFDVHSFKIDLQRAKKKDPTLQAFYEEIKQTDLLVIDDVHHFALDEPGRDQVLQILGFVILQVQGLVVLTSESLPQDLRDFDERLRSYLESGIVCDLEHPDRDLRIAILKRKLELYCAAHPEQSVALEPTVLEYLADHFSESIRRLTGALSTLLARTVLLSVDTEETILVRLDQAEDWLKSRISLNPPGITVDLIQKRVAEYYELKQAHLTSERRGRAIVRPRQIAMWLCKQLTRRSMPDIGRRFGGRDHTTVLHAIRRIEALRNEDPELARDLDILRRAITV